MTRPLRALMDADALVHNLERAHQYAPASKIMAIIKANAYGHGLAWAAQVLKKADAFGVASVEEGIELREAGIKQPICLLEGFFETCELPLLGKYHLAPVLHHESQLWDLENTANLPSLEVWVKVDTGMHRLGFSPEVVAQVLARLKVCLAVKKVRLMSHFANADNKFDATTPFQIQQLQKVAEGLQIERSLANSAGIVAWPKSHLEWVRPGIMLYGVSPMMGQSSKDLGLQPVMTLQSELIAVNQRRKGETIGYGGDWVCPEDMPVGVVAAGYGDGYPRHAPPGTPLLINGKRATLIGRVSMDMITVDLRETPTAQVGDPVILWGKDLPVDDIAERAGTIGYELLCGVTARVPRVDAKPSG